MTECGKHPILQQLAKNVRSTSVGNPNNNYGRAAILYGGHLTELVDRNAHLVAALGAAQHDAAVLQQELHCLQQHAAATQQQLHAAQQQVAALLQQQKDLTAAVERQHTELAAFQPQHERGVNANSSSARNDFFREHRPRAVLGYLGVAGSLKALRDAAAAAWEIASRLTAANKATVFRCVGAARMQPNCKLHSVILLHLPALFRLRLVHTSVQTSVPDFRCVRMCLPGMSTSLMRLRRLGLQRDTQRSRPRRSSVSSSTGSAGP